MSLIRGLVAGTTDQVRPIQVDSNGAVATTVGVGASVVRNGQTSGSQNTWTELAPAKIDRVSFFFQNTSDTEIEIGTGSAGAENLLVQVASKGTVSANAFLGGIEHFRLRVAVRCVSAVSKTYSARES